VNPKGFRDVQLLYVDNQTVLILTATLIGDSLSEDCILIAHKRDLPIMSFEVTTLDYIAEIDLRRFYRWSNLDTMWSNLDLARQCLSQEHLDS